MADRRISDLNPAPSTIDDSNTLFAVEQARTAYRVDGHAFITALTTILDGHGGISDIEYTAPSSGSLEGTLTITLADQSTTEVTITNGKAISSITQYFAVNNSSSSVPSSWNTTRQTMTSSNRYLWSYFTFAFNDNTSVDTPKSVIGVYGDTGDAWYIWIRYAGQQPTSDADIGTTPDDWIGIYSGTSSIAPTAYTSYTWYQYKGEKGDTGEASEVTSQSVTYMESSSGTVVPSGSWTSTVPTVAQGNFLWTKTEVVFNGDTQNPLVMYAVSRYGVDGTGSVSSVNNVSPDGTGNITITASDIQTSDNNSVQTHLTVAESSVTDLQTDIGDVSTLSGFTATDLTGAANELNSKTDTFVRPNLLDNWYFVGGGSQQGGGQFPINQRGQTVYSSSGYTVDRWKTSNTTITVDTTNKECVILTPANTTNSAWFQDIVGDFSNKTVTLSTIVSGTGDLNFTLRKTDYSIITGSAVAINGKTLISLTATVGSDVNALRIYYGGRTATDFKVFAVKLELGSTQTLAHQENGVWVLNEIPDYEEQLIRCNTDLADSGDTYANKHVAYDKLITGTITAASGFTVHEPTVRQYGKVVFAKFYATKNSGTITAGSYTDVATLSGVQRPAQQIRFVCGCGDAAYSAYKGCYCYYGAGGVFEVTPSANCSTVVIAISYIVE